ncbi:type II toxin-antitoxin system prevent-host-death family antitoxin [Ottowia sp.]|uniref:type II toxin-antitoxin system prevent-host-death family antitoxin n=1 Tax=Ottowia sp. TaxID=1898956 RepID=UPI002BD4CB2A|nr:type II toxin-antitoxin system prevent-host-death family antitoxin [Ottowia sp.]HMM72569.1 type II toxin-antitoxin system prevent-host-death family antitoxin [Rhodocyclaceae bacterium]HRN77095.1 type II toxin-antitoxin system prevent-host-death family antitoxin [Ottowia sp.]HRO52831.1 type II toxin-antitoxin system prevent-host-death family antitoxin [Alicycliphilus sp.]HRQ03979.1 type II toxin-antitoxin system prevent-host-death family antitoxin [Ottowia sp.]
MIHTVTSREFVHNVSASKRAAAAGNTVIITDRGQPALALMSIDEYRRLTSREKSMVELLRMPEADAYEFDPAPIRLEAQPVEISDEQA